MNVNKPGRELDKLVAVHVLGWQAAHGFEEECGDMPAFSTDVVAARMVLEKIVTFPSEDSCGKDVRYKFVKALCQQVKIPLDWDSDYEQIFACLMASPLAICRAALTAVGYKESS